MLVAAAAVLVHVAPLLSRVRDLAGDALIRVAAAFPPAPVSGAPDALVVAIDSQSLRELSDWPWPRSRWAELTRRLAAAGAAAIVFDIDFSTPRDPLDDAAFGAAIAASHRVVLGAFNEEQQVPGVGVLEMASLPIDAIASAATLASAISPLDPDGAVRRARRFNRLAERILPSMAVAAFTVALGHPPAGSADGDFPIDFRRAYPGVTVLSAADVLAGRVDLGAVAGRAVFVGSTAPILQDLWPTPIGGTVPGVMIQTTEFRHLVAMQAGRAVLHRTTLAQQCAWLALLSLLAGVLGRTTRAHRVPGALALASLVPFLALATVAATGLMVEPVSLFCVIAGHYALGVEAIRRGIHRSLVEREFSIEALGSLGRSASDRLGPDRLGSALALLGQATGADALTLAATREDGSVEPDGVSWSRAGRGRAIVRADVARETLAAGASRLFAELPRDSGHALYVPVSAGGQAVGVLVALHRSAPPGPEQVETTESFAALAALALLTDRLVHELRTARDAAEAASRAKSQFLANMSHEIRTPMTAVLGYLDLLDDPELSSEERASMMAALRTNGEHMLALIGAILDLGQIESGRLVIARDAFDPAELVRDVEAMLRPSARSAGLAIEIAVADGAPRRVESDRARLRQILVNLVANAIRYTPEGSVRIRVGSDDGSDVVRGLLRFEVSDTGVGIPEADRARIFEPFVLGDSSLARERSGAGLGLAIAKGLVELLGGSISVSSAVGAGSVFTFTIAVGTPLIDASNPEATSGPAAATLERLSGRALVVDDGADNRRILAHFLRKAGLDVALAADGRAACEMVVAADQTDEPFELVFMDVAMPIQDGHSAAREIRAAGLGVPIIALTAHAAAEDRDLALAAGCDDYLSKPVTRETLVATAARHLRSRKPEP